LCARGLQFFLVPGRNHPREGKKDFDGHNDVAAVVADVDVAGRLAVDSVAAVVTQQNRLNLAEPAKQIFVCHRSNVGDPRFLLLSSPSNIYLSTV
jgi:hypothetical protein